MIFIATHKNFVVPNLPSYSPIQVGAATSSADLGFLKDSAGDNISAKNPNFCELTALYWVWKNSNEPTKGLVHYRRYFGKSNLSASPSSIFSQQELDSLLSSADIVLPYVESFKQNAHDELLLGCCTPLIFNQLRDAVQSVQPDYLQDFDSFFAQNKASLFNMLYASADVFDSYCQWLFSILFALEKVVDLSPLDKYQQRLYGFLSERLLNVWVRHNRLRTVHTPVVNTELSLAQRLSLIRRRLSNQFVFSLHSHFSAL